MPRDVKIGKGEDAVEIKGLLDVEDLKALEDKLTKAIGKAKIPPPSATEDWCPDCGVKIGDTVPAIVAHLKSDPEKHGLVKTVTVTKEPEHRKIGLTGILEEFDEKHRKEKGKSLVDCPDCVKPINAFFESRGKKLVDKEEKEESWFG